MTLKIKRGAAAPDVPPTPDAPPATPPASEPTKRVRALVPPRAPASSKNKTRVLLNVLDGKIEWEKMTPEARKSFQDLFKDQEFLAQFGLKGGEKVFDPEQVKYLYDGISAMYQQIVKFFLRWPEGALKLLAYSEDDKKVLAEPTANLANKFAPAFLVKHQELIVWFSIFGAVTQKNFMAASAEARKMIAQNSAPPVRAAAPAARPQVITPIRPARPAPADAPAPTIEVPFSMPSDMTTEVGGASLEI